jgi:hypothetical protein
LGYLVFDAWKSDGGRIVVAFFAGAPYGNRIRVSAAKGNYAARRATLRAGT